MKLAILISYIPPYRVPLFHSLTSLAENLRIFVSTPMEPNRNWPAYYGNLDVQVQKDWMLPYKWKHPMGFVETLYLHFPYNTVTELSSYAPDAIISVEMGFRTLQAIVYKLIRPKVRLILWAAISEYTEEGRGWFRERLRSFIVSRVDAVIVNGESGVRYIRKFGIELRKIRKVPYTTDFSLFRFRPIYPDSNVQVRKLLYVGRFEQRKGIVSFLHILSAWCQENEDRLVEFDLAGDGPLRASIENCYVPRNLKINLLGNVSFHALADVYGNSHVLVFPTLADEWGMVVSEAMAVGRPVLGSIYSQAVEELVVENENGWTFRPDDVGEMKVKLNLALTTPLEDLARFGRKAREAVQLHTPGYAANLMMEAVKNAILGER